MKNKNMPGSYKSSSFCMLLAMVFLLLAPAESRGQEELPAEETISQGKLAIWCETIYFIYQDYGADSLAGHLNCREWEAFQESLQPNYLQTRTFFRSIEKPSVYAGYATDEAKLKKLVDEITKKLKASATRRDSPRRQQQVDSLRSELITLAENPVLFPGRQPQTEGMPGAAEAEEEASRPLAPTQADNGPETAIDIDPQQSYFMNELMQWLFIVILLVALLVMWYKNKRLSKEIGIRMARRKMEMAALAQKYEMPASPEPSLSNELSREEVQQLIEREIDKFHDELKNRGQLSDQFREVTPGESTKKAFREETLDQGRKDKAKDRSQLRGRSIEEGRGSLASAENRQPHRESESHSAGPVSEASSDPVSGASAGADSNPSAGADSRTSAGADSHASAGHPDHYISEQPGSLASSPSQQQVEQAKKEASESAENREAYKVSRTKEQEQQPGPSIQPGEEQGQASQGGLTGLKPGIYYDKLPFKGGFHQHQLSSQAQQDSTYSISISEENPEEAEFWVTEDADIQKYAMENGLSFFEEACEYEQVQENPTWVRNLSKGKLRKRGQLWRIEKKARVLFE